MEHTAPTRGKFDPESPLRHRRPVDLVLLARQTMGDRVLECDLLAMFNHQILVCLERIRAAKADAELAICLDALKTCALGVGAQNIAQLADNAERALAAGGSESAEALDDVAMAVEEACAYVSELLAD